MRIEYYQETDTLYIEFINKKYSFAEEVKDDYIIRVDSENKIVGLTIEHASKKLDLNTLETIEFPLKKSLAH